MNHTIIDEFNRLLSYIRDETDTFQQKKDMASVTKNNFRMKNLNIAVSVLKKVPFEITLENYKDLSEFDGIGKGTLDRVKEILQNGKLAELGDFVDMKKDKKDVITNLEEVVGIGRANALELYRQGITSVDDLKEKVKNGFTVNDKIKLGLKYYGKYELNIPRSEMDMYNKLFQKLIKKINTKLNLDDDHMYVVELCGSYRREKTQSNDIDVLISMKGTSSPVSLNHLERIVNKLKKPLKNNDMKPLLVDHMTDKKIKTKYMGFSKLLNKPIRRIDIRFVPYDSYYSALLYFTGSGDFNKKMRMIAKEKGYKLSEYGLFNEDEDMINVTSERDIFHKLKMEYLPPRLR